MRNCATLDPLVTPYVDGELRDADRRDVDDHLRVCTRCRSRITAEAAMRALIRARQPSLTAPAAPDALRARCAELAAARHTIADARPQTPHRAPAGRTAAWRSRIGPYALAASLVVFVGGAFLYQATNTSARLMAAQLVADHVKCFAMNRALGTQHTPSAVESSMASGFDWRMHLPEGASRAGLELVGARPCLYGEGRIAHIMYRHQGRPVSLFMLPKSARAKELVEVLGHEAAIWCVGNRTFVLVAKEPREHVERLAASVQAGLR